MPTESTNYPNKVLVRLRNQFNRLILFTVRIAAVCHIFLSIKALAPFRATVCRRSSFLFRKIDESLRNFTYYRQKDARNENHGRNQWFARRKLYGSLNWAFYWQFSLVLIAFLYVLRMKLWEISQKSVQSNIGTKDSSWA